MQDALYPNLRPRRVVSNESRLLLQFSKSDSQNRELNKIYRYLQIFGNGMQTMRVLGRNMAWLIKCIELGKKNNILKPELEERQRTNFIR